MVSRRLLQKILPFWLLILVIGSFLPGEEKRALGTQSGDEGPRWGHRAYHLGSFAFTGLLASLVTRRSRRRFAMCVAVVGLGLGIEMLQPVVFNSEFEWWDVLDDAAGAITAGIIGEAIIVRQFLVRE